MLLRKSQRRENTFTVLSCIITMFADESSPCTYNIVSLKTVEMLYVLLTLDIQNEKIM